MTEVRLIRLIKSDLEYQIDQSDQTEAAGSQKRASRVNRFGDSSKLNIGAGSVYKPHYIH